MIPDLSIVIVNYNAGRLLRNCLWSVLHRMTGLELEVIVVDNGSRDGSLEAAGERFPQVNFIRNKTNLGFARATNQGIRASKGRYVLLLNPDTTVLNDGATDWIRYMDAHPQVGISGGKIYYDETKRRVQLSCRGFPSVWNALFSRYSPLSKLFPNNRYAQRFLMADWDHNQTRQVDWVSGCCLLLRREALESIGLLDEGYKLFFEDVDLCYDAHQAGWQVTYYPALEIAHFVGSLRAQAAYRTLAQRHLSLWRFYKKHHQRRRWLNPFFFAGIFSRMGFLAAGVFLKRVLPYTLDVALIQLSVVLAYGTRLVWEFLWMERTINAYFEVVLPYTLIQIALLYLFDLYPHPHSRYEDYQDVLPKVFKAVTLGSLVLVFIVFFGRQLVFPRSIILFGWFYNILLLAGWRWLVLYLRQRHLAPKRVLIYGTGPLASLVNDELRWRSSLKCQPVGFIRPVSPPAIQAIDPDLALGGVDELEALVARQQADEIVFAAEARSDEEVLRLMQAGVPTHINTQLAPDLFELASGGAHLDHYQRLPLDPARYRTRATYLRFKRGLDLLCASLLLVVVSPLMALIALKLKLDFGKVFSRQRRVGLNGHPFHLYKFRTAAQPADADYEDVVSMTPFGRFLRLTRLDELPQLASVLRGEMSLVGPRAESVELATRMDKAIPWFDQRHTVRPGMTGWAQVEYKHTTSVQEYREKLQYDLYYLKNVSLALDFKILVKTAWMVLTGKGAR